MTGMLCGTTHNRIGDKGMTKYAEIMDEVEGFLIRDDKTGAEYMGGHSYEEAERTAENMGYTLRNDSNWFYDA